MDVKKANTQVQAACSMLICCAVELYEAAKDELTLEAKLIDGRKISVNIKEVVETENETADNWISVEDGLPENEDEVLVWYEYFRYGSYNRMFRTYGLARYIQRYDMWSGDDLNGTAVKVLRWQPLPKPPKEADDENE